MDHPVCYREYASDCSYSNFTYNDKKILHFHLDMNVLVYFALISNISLYSITANDNTAQNEVTRAAKQATEASGEISYDCTSLVRGWLMVDSSFFEKHQSLHV